jgi:thiamine transport system ATP-binding protein
VSRGEFVVVVGPNGSGKTTLLRALAGLQRIDTGAIAWNRTSVTDLPPHERGFGLMFQDYALFPHRNVGENVAFGLRMQHRDPRATRRRVAEVLEWVGLSGYEDRSVGSLSGGEQQRVALARALAPEPVLLMLDEPVGSLDRTLRERLVGELRQLLAEIGITSIYVTHDQEEAFALADRVLVLRDGHVVQEGTPQDVWAHPADEWVARFLGLTNIVDATVSDGVAVTAWGTFPVDGVRDGPCRLVVRPDAFRVEDTGGLPAKIVDRSFRGGRWVVHALLDDGPPMSLELPQAPAPGDEVHLRIDPQGVTALPSA